MNKHQNEFWDKAADIKEFKDPFYLAQLKTHIHTNSLIIEYGCGYGRLVNFLYENGFHNTRGFDFSQGMVERGKKQFPSLHIELINHALLPLQKETVDAVILSTVLCCVPSNESQKEIIDEISRVLKPNAILYLTDFLITNSEHMMTKYQRDLAAYNEWGIYQTSEGALVRHHTEEYIAKLLDEYKVTWYREEEFITMNNNPVKTFHGVYKKK